MTIRKSNSGVDIHISEEDFRTSKFMDTASLPSGWERRITADGRIFYVDHNEMKITHAPPRRVVKPGVSFLLLEDVDIRSMPTTTSAVSQRR